MENLKLVKRTIKFYYVLGKKRKIKGGVGLTFKSALLTLRKMLNADVKIKLK